MESASESVVFSFNSFCFLSSNSQVQRFTNCVCCCEWLERRCCFWIISCECVLRCLIQFGSWCDWNRLSMHEWLYFRQRGPLSCLNINQLVQQNLVILINLSVFLSRYELIMHFCPFISNFLSLFHLIPNLCNLRHSF